jgi:hypothetical protein
VFDVGLGASVNAAARQSIDQPDRSIGAHQQQRPGVGRDLPAIERRYHAAPANTRKLKLFDVILCLHRELSCGECNLFW